MNVQKEPVVIIIGGGPAGLSTALCCADLGLQAVLLEMADVPGGQMLWTHNPITNYPGVTAKKGSELADLFATDVQRSKIEVITGAKAVAANLKSRTVDLEDGTSYSARAVVIATGVRRRRLGVPGEAEFAGRGILASGALERDSVAGKKVVIVGGGDAALENSLILGEKASEVIVVHRRDEFSARDEFVNAARERGNVSLMANARVTAINGNDRVQSVTVATAHSSDTIECDAILIRIGVEPNTELFRGQLDVDERGYVVVDKELKTSITGIWAVGDVTGPVAMTIATAIGHGASAAKSIALAI